MATTPVGGYPYPVGSDSPDAPFWLQGLAQKIEARVDAGWTAYVPVLKRADTGANLASSGATGKYLKLGRLVIVKGQIVSTNAGIGVGVMVTMPTGAGIAPSTADLLAGTCGIFGGSAPTDQSGLGRLNNDNTAVIPWKWSTAFVDPAAGNTIRWNVMYEVA